MKILIDLLMLLFLIAFYCEKFKYFETKILKQMKIKKEVKE